MSVHWLDPLLKEARFGALRELHEADIKDKDTIVRDIIHSSCRFDESIFFYDGKFFQFSQFGFSMRFSEARMSIRNLKLILGPIYVRDLAAERV
jgi:hypothetical protein